MQFIHFQKNVIFHFSETTANRNLCKYRKASTALIHEHMFPFLLSFMTYVLVRDTVRDGLIHLLVGVGVVGWVRLSSKGRVQPEFVKVRVPPIPISLSYWLKRDTERMY
jgi:hypothetical protein